MYASLHNRFSRKINPLEIDRVERDYKVDDNYRSSDNYYETLHRSGIWNSHLYVSPFSKDGLNETIIDSLIIRRLSTTTNF